MKDLCSQQHLQQLPYLLSPSFFIGGRAQHCNRRNEAWGSQTLTHGSVMRVWMGIVVGDQKHVHRKMKLSLLQLVVTARTNLCQHASISIYSHLHYANLLHSPSDTTIGTRFSRHHSSQLTFLQCSLEEICMANLKMFLVVISPKGVSDPQGSNTNTRL